MNKNIKTALKFDRRDASTLSSNEKALFESLMLKSRAMGLSISVISEAPANELALAESSARYEEIKSKYPNRIRVFQS